MSMLVVNHYLVVYNAVQLATWTMTVVHLVGGLSWTWTTIRSLPLLWVTWSATAATRALRAVRIGQTLAWLEVLHVIFRLNPTTTTTSNISRQQQRDETHETQQGKKVISPVPTFIQCLGRFAVLSWVITPIVSTHTRVETWLLFFVWAIADIVRYSLYLLTLIRVRPLSVLVKSITWMRYSLFIVLQPIGLVCEWVTYWNTLKYVDEDEVYRVRLPNRINMAFDFGIWNRIVLGVYVYAGPYMMRHMMQQRRRKLVVVDEKDVGRDSSVYHNNKNKNTVMVNKDDEKKR